jgi:hypothetical protein
MATFIDGEELSGNDPFAEEQTEVRAEVKPEPEVKEDVPELPEKYKGKKLEDIIKMHQEAERLIGKQAQEVGEVRKLADELIKQQLAPKVEKPTKEEETEVDFFVDPKTAVRKAVEEHPDVVQARMAAAELKAEKAKRSLAEKHPDAMQVVQDPEFAEWVKASKVRTALFVAADQQMDLDAADELLSTFKALKPRQQATTSTVTKDDAEALRQSSLKAASVDASGTGEAPKKIYRRADLIRLKMTDPDRYNAMQDEILAAYASGRVK